MKVSKLCIILRAPPGSGKSFTVNELKKTHNISDDHIFSTDNFWIPKSVEAKKAGKIVSIEEELAEYRANWNPALLGKAHKNNFDNFKNAVDKGIAPVIVDNCNTKIYEFKNYADYATNSGYEVRIMEPSSPWWKEYSPYLKDKTNYKQLEKFAMELFRRNQHGVPLDVIKNVIKKWEII